MNIIKRPFDDVDNFFKIERGERLKLKVSSRRNKKPPAKSWRFFCKESFL
jgi:hypothetical protein